MRRPAPRLYLITPPQFELEVFAPTLDETLQEGDIACLQIRLKQPDGSPVEDDTIRRAVEILCPLAQQHNVAVLLNDRPDLARDLGCDGVHIGQNDMDHRQARTLLGDKAIIGVTCHASRHLAMLAGRCRCRLCGLRCVFRHQNQRHKRTTEPRYSDLVAGGHGAAMRGDWRHHA